MDELLILPITLSRFIVNTQITFHTNIKFKDYSRCRCNIGIDPDLYKVMGGVTFDEQPEIPLGYGDGSYLKKEVYGFLALGTKDWDEADLKFTYSGGLYYLEDKNNSELFDFCDDKVHKYMDVMDISPKIIDTLYSTGLYGKFIL